MFAHAPDRWKGLAPAHGRPDGPFGGVAQQTPRTYVLRMDQALRQEVREEIDRALERRYHRTYVRVMCVLLGLAALIASAVGES